MSKAFIFILSCLFLVPLLMSEEKKPMTLLSFETGIEGQKLKSVDGISGRGVLLLQDTQIRFPVKNNISLEKGTISLWIKPVNWNASCQEGYTMVSLFDSAESPIGGWAKHHESSTLGISLYLKGENPTWLGFGSDPRPLEKWSSGTWHNLVFTFSQEEFAIYLDTVQVGVCPGESSKELWQRLQQSCYFQMGGAYKGTDFSSVIDELAIYDVVLSEEEISRAFKKMILNYLE